MKLLTVQKIKIMAILTFFPLFMKSLQLETCKGEQSSSLDFNSSILWIRCEIYYWHEEHRFQQSLQMTRKIYTKEKAGIDWPFFLLFLPTAPRARVSFSKPLFVPLHPSLACLPPQISSNSIRAWGKHKTKERNFKNKKIKCLKNYPHSHFSPPPFLFS